MLLMLYPGVVDVDDDIEHDDDVDAENAHDNERDYFSVGCPGAAAPQLEDLCHHS